LITWHEREKVNHDDEKPRWSGKENQFEEGKRGIVVHTSGGHRRKKLL